MFWFVVEKILLIATVGLAVTVVVYVSGYRAEVEDLRLEVEKVHNRLDVNQTSVVITDLDRPSTDQINSPTRPDWRAQPLVFDPEKYGKHAPR